MNRHPCYVCIATTTIVVSFAVSLASFVFRDRSEFVLVLSLISHLSCVLGLYFQLVCKQLASPALCVFVAGASIFHASVIAIPAIRTMIISLPPFPYAWLWPWSCAGAGLAVCAVAVVRRRTWAESPAIVGISALLAVGGIVAAICFAYLILGSK